MEHKTEWRQASLIILSGIIGAAQIGKAAIAVPLIQADLQLTLFAVSWIVSAYAILGAFGGMAAGFVVSLFAIRRVLVGGLLLIALGNVWGATSFGMAGMLASRALEGVGFLLVAISGPTLIRTVANDRDRPLILGLWSAYIPVGAAIMMLAGPLIMQGDWRVLWFFNAAISAIAALLVQRIIPLAPPTRREADQALFSDVVAVLRRKELRLLALAFLLYAIQYFALATFLPILLTDRLGFSLAQAGMISALALTMNAAGNVIAGLSLKHGISLFAIMTAAFATVGISGFGIFLDISPTLLVAVASGICLGVAALLPAAIISTVPQYAPTQRKLALGMGMIQQSSGFGQMIGPALIAFWVERYSWNGVPYMFAAIALTGFLIALFFHRRHG
ncbi:MFS transporter [Mesorhizobium xinjiangense]|uniref:MFS transporter n=1 Tax=Mesorhizobium xinjiangense TaxID=2678685 RepID=UPI0012EE0A38|nr:MFS transporter [Mesorhizobium xinjiangense]